MSQHFGRGVSERLIISGSGGGHVIEDEGTPLPQRANLNFVGAGVTATDDAGNNATVITIPGGSGSPGGLTTQVQFNDAGSFGGDAGFTYDKTTDTITLVGAVNAGGRLFSNTSLVLEETGVGTDIITIQAPASIAASYTLTLPINDGNSGDVLSTDGAGVLSWFGMTAALANKISRDGTTTTTAEIPFAAGLSTLYSLSSLGYGMGSAPLTNAVQQNTLNRDMQFLINGVQAFKLDITSGHESNYDILFPSAKGVKFGSLSAPTSSIIDSGSGLVINSRVSGTAATVVTYNLNVSPAQDVYSQFGATGANTQFAPTDTTDRLLSWKVASATTGVLRAGLFIAEFNGTSNSTAQFAGNTAAMVTPTAASANLTSTTNGGQKGMRALINHMGSGTISEASAYTGRVSGATITAAHVMNFEVPTIDTGITWADYHHAIFRFGSTSTRITNGYGAYFETIPSNFATNGFQQFMVGTGARHGIYFNQAGEYLRSSSANHMEGAATTSWRTVIGSTARLVVDAADSSFDTNVKLNTVGNGIYIKEGTNATMGLATLVTGTVVVNTTKVTANSRIHLTPQTTSAASGFIGVSARTAGTSFTILSSNALDANNIAWAIFEPA